MSNTSLFNELGLQRDDTPVQRSPSTSTVLQPLLQSEISPDVLHGGIITGEEGGSSTRKRSREHDDSGDGTFSEIVPLNKRRRTGDRSVDNGGDVSETEPPVQSSIEFIPGEGSKTAENDQVALLIDPNKSYSARFVGNGPVYINDLEVGNINVDPVASRGSRTIIDSLNTTGVVGWPLGIPGGGVQNIFTFVIPANTMKYVGDQLIITVRGNVSNTADAKSIRYYLGNLLPTSHTITVSQGGEIEFTVVYSRIDGVNENTYGWFYSSMRQNNTWTSGGAGGGGGGNLIDWRDPMTFVFQSNTVNTSGTEVQVQSAYVELYRSRQ